MSLPAPYSQVPDRVIVDGCIGGDPDAFEALWQRCGRLMHTTIAMTLDGHGRGDAREATFIYRRMRGDIQRSRSGILRRLGPDASLRHCFAVLAQEAAASHVEDETPVARLRSPAPTPAELLLDDLVGLGPARDVTLTLRKLSPQIMAILRFELRGLTSREIAAALGTTQETIYGHLERTAGKVAELTSPAGERELSLQLWRSLLRCDDVADKVALSIRCEDDPDVAARRLNAQRTWAALRERALSVPQPHSVDCLEETHLAHFVAGMRGAERARAEGHVTTCGRCADRVANLVLHLRSVPTLRAADAHEETIAVAAACVATDHPRPALAYAQRAEQEGTPKAEELRRLALARRRLAVSQGELQHQESSRVVARDDLPTDDEAPLLAMEALVAGDISSAVQALDDHVAKRLVGARLRLLAMASGHDLEGGRVLAEAAATESDPDLQRDAQIILALPSDRALPREMLVARLVDLMPSVVRLVLSQS